MATFQYKDYTESAAVKAAQAALAQQNANKPGAYQSQWQSKINDTLGKIENRDPFTYDVNGDALYQQYAQQFAQKGKMAMQDTMGQAAAMTGGYGNSYAATVGNQAYQSYLTEANNAIPTFYQMALDNYTRQGQELKDLYSLYSDRENVDYGKYRDEVGDWQSERDYLANIYYNERDFDYGKYTDDRDFSYGNFRDDISDQQWEKEYAQAVAQYNANLAYQQERDRIADEQWAKQYELMLGEYNAKYGTGSTGGNTTTGGNTANRGSDLGHDELSVADIKRIQQALGVTVDGKWGPETAAAAGTNVPADAMERFLNGEYDNRTPAPTYSSIASDLDDLIAAGASKSEINSALRDALNNGHISQSEYNKLKDKYAPRGYTY